MSSPSATRHEAPPAPSSRNETTEKTTTTPKTYVFTSPSGEEIVLDLTNATTTRPHARKVKGSVMVSKFTPSSSTLVFEYSSDGASESEPTELFVPYIHFPTGYRVTASDGHCAIEKHAGYDIIKHEHDNHAHKHRLVVEKTKKVAAASSWFGWATHSNVPVYVALGLAVIAPYLSL